MVYTKSVVVDVAHQFVDVLVRCELAFVGERLQSCHIDTGRTRHSSEPREGGVCNVRACAKGSNCCVRPRGNSHKPDITWLLFSLPPKVFSKRP